jgi:phage tail-like protein
MTIYGHITVQLGEQLVLTTTLIRTVFKIGRLPDNDLVLPSSRVSQRHAEIRVESQGVVVTDLGSVDGTVVDGVRLRPLQPTPLKHDAKIQLGPYSILFRFLGAGRELAGDAGGFKGRIGSLRSASQSESFTGGRDERSGGLLSYLPIIFHGNDFLRRYLQIFEAIWEPLEQRQDHISMYFDPMTCPSALLPWLASWFGLTLNPHWPESRSRALLAEAFELYRWRGTKYGIARMIEVYTGFKPEVTQSASEPFVFRIRVVVPDKDRALVDSLDELIRAHKPAHAGYVLEVL